MTLILNRKAYARPSAPWGTAISLPVVQRLNPKLPRSTTPGTYLAGGYNRLQTKIAGRMIENEDLVNMPNWLITRFRPEGGDWFNLRSVDILFFRQELDLQQGLLRRTVRYKDKQGRETTLMQRWFVHMERMHFAALQTTIVPENWGGVFS
jgi:alpha,alpha-trehalase